MGDALCALSQDGAKLWSARQDSNLRVTALEVPCLIHLGHWRKLGGAGGT